MSNKLPSLQEFFRANNLATASDSELSAEQERRQLMRNFPLHVFHPKIKPFLNALHKEYDLPRSYIGLAIISAISSSVGSSYHIKQNKLGTMYFPVWACLEGISSAGKSLVMSQVFRPLYQIQSELDEEWLIATEGKTPGEIAMMKSKQLIYGDAHLATLTKTVIPANPKGILQDADEILAWINGMNQLAKGNKEGTDEQFWMKSWDCKEHRTIRAGNQIYVIKKPYLNVFGGAQPSIIHKLFKNDRDTTGFIYRLLFAVPETHKIAEPNLAFDMPEEWERIHNKCLNSLYRGLPVDEDSESRSMILDHRAMSAYNKMGCEEECRGQCQQRPADEGKAQRDLRKDEGVLLALCGAAAPGRQGLRRAAKFLSWKRSSTEGTMARAVELADYFFEAAQNITDRVNKAVIASPDVIRIASYVKAGFSFTKIGALEFPELKSEGAQRAKATRMVRRLLQ
jgi:hypothetical protein